MIAAATPSALAAQQQALLRALHALPAENAIQFIARDVHLTGTRALRGLKTYQANGQALAIRALSAAYPVLAALLGDESFAGLAQEFWSHCPPVRGDMACWGAALPEFVQSATQLASEPYLADVARVEWALHTIAIAADAQPDPDSFALLGTADPDAVTLVLCPGTQTIASTWPVVSIVQAHRTGNPGLEEAGRRLRDGVAEAALVWRRGLRPMLRELTDDERRLIDALRSGASLLQALDASGMPEFDQWLPRAVADGLVTGARTI